MLTEPSDTQGLHMLPNPARFTLNGIHFAATSVDVLFHLRNHYLLFEALRLVTCFRY